MDNKDEMNAEQILCRRNIIAQVAAINNLARQITVTANMYDERLMRALMPHIDKILEANNSILSLSNTK